MAVLGSWCFAFGLTPVVWKHNDRTYMLLIFSFAGGLYDFGFGMFLFCFSNTFQVVADISFSNV